MTASAPTEILLLRRELALRKREAELRRDNEIRFFGPHFKQNCFFGAAGYRRRYARTGNRFGKSEMGACEDVAFALGYRPWYAEGDPRRVLGIPTHCTKGLIVTIDWDKSEEIFTCQDDGANRGKLFKYIPKDAFVEATKNHSGAIDRIVVRHISGENSVIHLDTVQSYKQSKKSQESSAWDWVHIDEPCPEQMWKAIARGLVDRNGKAWFTCTPIDEPWIDQKFVPDLEMQSKESTEDVTSADHWMMTGTTRDNPYNSEDSIRMFESELTPEEIETRINGRPAAYAGVVCKEFNWNVHVWSHEEPPPGWSSFSKPPPHFAIRYAIDYHPRKNNAVLFIATSDKDIHYVFEELWTPDLIHEMVGDIKRICPSPVVPSPVDPLASTPNKVTDLSFMEELQNLGLPVIPATKDPGNGIIGIRKLLKERQKGSAEPVIYFFKSCARTLFEISRGWVWDEDTNKPKKQNDDMMENLYRLVLQGLFYIPPADFDDYHTIPERSEFSGVSDPNEFDQVVRPSRSRDMNRYRM